MLHEEFVDCPAGRLGVETSIVEVSWIIHELARAEIRHVPHKYSRFDLPRSVYDFAKIHRLGYEPIIGLRDGIEELFARRKEETV